MSPAMKQEFRESLAIATNYLNELGQTNTKQHRKIVALQNHQQALTQVLNILFLMHLNI